LKELKDKYDITGYMFLDSTMNVSKKHVECLCKEMIKSKLNIVWSDSARADNLDKELLLLLREAGCVKLILGMDGSSPKMLKYINKQININRLEQIVRWADEAGIWIGIDTMVGFPYEEKSDLNVMVDFLKRNTIYINTIYYNMLSIRDGSILYLYPEKYGIKSMFEVSRIQNTTKKTLKYVKYGYDEIEGLKWEEKLKQMNEGYDYVASEIQKINFPVYEMEQLLFFLYKKYENKKDVVRIYSMLSECVQNIYKERS
jgi:radical SAM superfamily enzyme YgiQ (UPF0313 family)